MISFNEWWNETVGDGGQWTTLERLAARDAWHHARAEAIREAREKVQALSDNLGSGDWIMTDKDRAMEDAYDLVLEILADKAGAAKMRTVKQLQELSMRKKNARVLRKIALRRWKEMRKSDRTGKEEE